MKLDAIIVAAHPDDAEISMGGTILSLTRAGKKVGIVDVTRGELGSRGDRASRDAETEAASRVMDLAVRHNLEQPDGRVQASVEAREALAAVLREHRPEVVIAHHADDLHPDHSATGRLAKDAWYLAGLKRLAELAGGAEAKRPPRLLHFMGHTPFDPTFVVDITSVWEAKVELVRCYETQLEPANEEDTGKHFLFGADILQRMETKARFFGERIGVAYGEPLLSEAALPIGPGLLISGLV